MKNVSVLFLLLANQAIYSQTWKTNFNDALKEASATGKEVLLLFSVADNCDSCLRLEKNVLQSEEFLAYTKDNYVLVKQDFQSNTPESIEENLLIVEKYNKDGFFPLLVMVNKNAKIVGQLGTYNNETPAQYIAKLKSAKRS